VTEWFSGPHFQKTNFREWKVQKLQDLQPSSSLQGNIGYIEPEADDTSKDQEGGMSPSIPISPKDVVDPMGPWFHGQESTKDDASRTGEDVAQQRWLARKNDRRALKASLATSQHHSEKVPFSDPRRKFFSGDSVESYSSIPSPKDVKPDMTFYVKSDNKGACSTQAITVTELAEVDALTTMKSVTGLQAVESDGEVSTVWASTVWAKEYDASDSDAPDEELEDWKADPLLAEFTKFTGFAASLGAFSLQKQLLAKGFSNESLAHPFLPPLKAADLATR